MGDFTLLCRPAMLPAKLMRIRSRIPAALLGLVAAVSAVCTASAVTIWPVGDSLTSGFNVAGAYRTQLHADLVAAGTTVNFVGSSTADASGPLTAAGQTRHDGHSGWFIADTAAAVDNGRGIFDRVSTWFPALSDTPDVILLMIGTNDLNQGNLVASAPSRLDSLLTRLETLSPDARIIVASIPAAEENNIYKNPAVTNLDGSIRSYNTSVENLVASHASLGRNVEFLDVYSAMSPADLSSDGLHFSQAGYNKLGSLWAESVLVPEPSAAALFAAGVLGGVFRRRRVAE